MTDLLRGLLFLSRFRMLTVLTIACLVLFANAYSYHEKGESWGDQVPMLFGVVVLIALLAAQFYYRSRQMKKSPSLQGMIRYRFDDSGMRIEGPHSEAELRWPGIVKWRESGSTFFIYPTSRLANMVPKRFFASEQDVAAVRELLRAHIAKKK